MKTIITTIASIVLTITTFAQKVSPMIGTVTTTQPTCYGYSNGEISLNTSGGLPPYTYIWSTGDTTQTISNLPAGNYSVLVNDAMGNAMGGFFTITEPSQITVTGTNTNTAFNTSNGTIDILSIDNTIGGYTYVWSSNNGQAMNQSTLDQTGLKAGNYKLYVTDANGCEGVGYFQINNVIVPVTNPNFKTKPFANNTTAISTYPNPSNGNFTVESKEVINEIRVVNATTGLEVLKSDNSENKFSVNDLPQGVYTIYVTTEMGTEIERVSVL